MGEKPVSIMTKWTNYCMICGNPTVEMHHALYGSKHKQADEDHLLMSLCPNHHNSSKMSVHMNPEMKALSQMLAQVCWERQKLAQWYTEVANELVKDDNPITIDAVLEKSREAFFDRYGEYYL